VQSGRAVDLAKTPTAQRPLLRAKDLLAPGIGPVTFDVRPGEIVGVFGLVGSGRTELLETLFGAQGVHGGTLEFNGKPLHMTDPAGAVAAGIALVPADRLRKSVLASLPASDNVLISTLALLGLGGIRRTRNEHAIFDRIASRLNLEPRRRDLEARRFSGGNQQKLVLARWLNEAHGCTLLLCDEPTQGVDIGARREIYDALRIVSETRDRAVIMTSSEPQELMQIAHRVIVLSGGLIAGVLSGEDATEDRLLALAHRIEPLENITR
jgi:ribose transport system ATP-binding protein